MRGEDGLKGRRSMENKARQRLLIVDDSRETVAGLCLFFSTRYQVFTAYTGYEGMRLLESVSPPIDLMVSDLILQDLSGIGLISMVKERFPGLPVIAITGWAADPEKLQKMTGADAVLCKPFELEELDGHVCRLLEGNQK
jgi:DNA-binding response OmpR family regulator